MKKLFLAFFVCLFAIFGCKGKINHKTKECEFYVFYSNNYVDTIHFTANENDSIYLVSDKGTNRFVAGKRQFSTTAPIKRGKCKCEK